ncbi:hypothetical protein [Caminibacter mediatlanticus]|uniref:T4 RNA ligase 1-like N-terminal domain-containing protein n=1 Tax=Caminibacter mediatlanticus TB-2 TaxID=391592 RepID=A0AAI9AGR3_9BACT|nr:hypothetical protein [Caminibacter mediatlanticus]EDM23337.1 hypothetical protein CMTB2_08735 [Caminibacter mediatlanticus TB-2]
MFFIPTKKECDYIVENSKQFFKKEIKFLNKNISIYHYKQAKYEEFVKFNAWELRGLTFVEYKRFLSLHKFFELNQAPGWMKEDVKNKKIKKVVEKIDGSLLQPILIDGKIYFKTKLSFDAYQAKRANEIMLKNLNIKEYIIKCFEKNKIPLFEYISQKSQVVMDYNKEELINTQVRDLNTGEYDLEFEKEALKYNITTPKSYDFNSLDEIINEAKNNKNIEGWVVIFEDMQFLKVKTEEYLKRHKIVGKIQPHEVIKALIEKDKIYEETLNRKSEKYKVYADIKEKFLKKYNTLKNEAKKTLKLSKKEFKKKYSTHSYYELFALCRNKGVDEFDRWIKKHTARLKGAKKFLELEE